MKDKKEDLEDRSHFIGGSDARIIMGGDESALTRLWQEKRGETEPPDLSGNLIVQLGLVTEGLNRFWYERTSGHRVGQCQTRKFHATIVWMAATLDGLVEQTGAVFESKFMLPWSFSEEAAARKAHGSAATQYDGCGHQTFGALDHHRRRQVGGDRDPGRSGVPNGPALSGPFLSWRMAATFLSP